VNGEQEDGQFWMNFTHIHSSDENHSGASVPLASWRN